jgi:hypothetical protein
MLAEKMGRENDSERLYKIVQGNVENPRGKLLADISRALGYSSERELRFGKEDLRSEDIASDGHADLDPAHSRQKGGIREIDVRAGLGGGGTTEGREVMHRGNYADPLKEEGWTFPSRFVREELRASEDRVIILETQGDSMAPTILSGDRVIVDTGHVIPTPDGIYAVRDQYGSIVVKRLQTLRRGDPPIIRIISDNKAHDAEDVSADEIAVVGRVLWGLKRL